MLRVTFSRDATVYADKLNIISVSNYCSKRKKERRNLRLPC